MTAVAEPIFLCTGTLGRIPWEEKARAAAGAGFARLSIYQREHQKLLQRGWEDGALRKLLEELNLGVAEYDGAVMTMQSPDGTDEIVAAAATLGARSITVLEGPSEHGGWVPRDNLGQAAATLGEIADQAADHGILTLIEPFAWSPLDDHRVAARIVELADRPNTGLLLDTWHLWRGPERGRLDRGIDPSIIKAIQIGDTGPEPPGNPTGHELAHECIHHRLMPGDGHGDLAGMLADLKSRGVKAPPAVEVFSDVLYALAPHDVARRCMDSVGRLLGAVEQRGK